jgi:hypothetical protein
MRRRKFIAGVGGAVSWTVVSRAQPPALPEIGFLNGHGAHVGPIVASLLKGLNTSVSALVQRHDRPR